MNILSWIIDSILIQNVVLSRFLGTCPFLGVSKNKKSAVGMGVSVVLIITISSIVSWLIYNYVLVKLDLAYMRTIVYILIIASLVQMLEMVIKKISYSLYTNLGVYLPLITTNCAVLGIATIVSNYSFFKALVVSFASGLGFLFAIVIFSAIRSNLEHESVPKSFKGIPISLITAGLMAMIISRFSGV